MGLGITGKVAIISGAGLLRGIGFACAKRLCEEGAKVLLTDIVPDGAEMRAGELRAAGFDAAATVQDATNERGWDAVIGMAIDQWGRLDILVNNAGVSTLAPAIEMTLDQFNRQIELNVTSVFLGSRAAMRQMRAQGGGGAIVNMSSVTAFVTGMGSSAYSASKAAVHMYSKTLALEGAAEGIRVNTVHPGITNTDMLAKALSETPESVKAMASSIPALRMAEPNEIAAAVAFFASGDASYCNGSSLVIDGGVLLQ
jgi:NAD(P)-dependent dehydrogenase (short-subunit alcohol dehydrogenase family)